LKRRLKRYKALPLVTPYWRPGHNFTNEIVKAVGGKVKDGDYVVVSEKAISTALGNVRDEGDVKAGRMAHLLARFWTRIVWGFCLGRLCRLRNETVERVRRYPLSEGGRHKQTVLDNVGFLNALMFGSEGGIDGVNLPYSFVALPLPNPTARAETIRKALLNRLNVNVTVIISDTDKTYTWRNLHFTPRPTQVRAIHSIGGFLSYMFGRVLKLDRHPTPLAVAGDEIDVEEALKLAEVANKARGHGSSRTIVGMSSAFGVPFDRVTWEMLDKVTHRPIVMIRQIHHERVK